MFTWIWGCMVLSLKATLGGLFIIITIMVIGIIVSVIETGIEKITGDK